jgi:RND family efflux transporter MFP subunit
LTTFDRLIDLEFFMPGRFAAASALAIVFFFVTACDQSTDQQAAPAPEPPEVTVASPLIKQIVEWDEYTGRFEAVERVEIRARVDGYLDSVSFTDGAIVEKDQVLFTIDQRPFQIALNRARAELEFAQKEFNRFEALSRTNAASRARLDEAQEALRLARSGVQQAELDLEFSVIRAPIAGRISRSLIDVGNLISGDTNATLLTTIVSLDPIHFYFEASEQQFLKYSRLNEQGARTGSRDTANPIYIRLQDEKEFTHIGRMDFVDNEIDANTGTILGRAILENEDEVLTPGLFGRARLLGSGIYDAVMVPDTAIGTNQSRKFVTIVNSEDKAEMRFVEVGPLRDSGLRIVRSGLSADDRVIVNGLQRARPGTTVRTKDTTIEEPDTGPTSTIPPEVMQRAAGSAQ